MAKPDLDTISRNFWLPAPEDADGDSVIFVNRSLRNGGGHTRSVLWVNVGQSGGQ